MSIWSFKRKRFPDGRVMKHKARICAHGGQQIFGVNNWDIYSPFVTWISVKLLLIKCNIDKLESESI